jgi:membrane protein YqaA with SNARE-associated domain
MSKARIYAKRAALAAFIFQIASALVDSSPNSPFAGANPMLRLGGGIVLALILAAVAAVVGAAIGYVVDRVADK